LNVITVDATAIVPCAHASSDTFHDDPAVIAGADMAIVWNWPDDLGHRRLAGHSLRGNMPRTTVIHRAEV
jgi:hypothetical protein